MLTKKCKILASWIVSVSMILSYTAYAKTTLRIQTSTRIQGFSFKYFSENWAPKISEMTKGEIHMELVPINSVMPKSETPEAISAGILSGDLTSIAYFSGRDPAFAILGDLIAGYDTPAQVQGFCREGGGKEILQKLWDKTMPGKIHVIGCGAVSKEAFVSKVPIRGFDDLKGLKIRTPEGLAASVFREAGAVSIILPFTDISEALEAGAIDASDASAYVNNDRLGFNKIGHFPLYPGIHSMAVHQFTISTEIWEEMKPEHQKALVDWYHMAYADLLRALDAEDQRLVDRDKTNPDMEIIDWSQEDRNRLREVAIKVWEETADQSSQARIALDAHYKYMKKIGIIE